MDSTTPPGGKTQKMAQRLLAYLLQFPLLSEHIFFVGACAACLITLLSVPEFSVILTLKALLVGLIPAIGWGGLAVELLVPDMQPKGAKAGIILGVGYVLSILIGFGLGWLRVFNLYPLLGALAFLLWLGRIAFVYTRTTKDKPVDFIPAQGSRLLQSKSVWIVLSIALLSISAASPFMAPVRRTGAELFMDYSYIDTYYHVIRAQVLSQGPPASIYPDMVGAPPIAYPDYHHLWMGMLKRWTDARINNVYFIYAPLLLILMDIVVLFGVGELLTGSRWGGYLAAAMAYLIFLPNPWDAVWHFVPNVVQGISAYEVHLYGLRFNLSVSAGWFVFTTIVLVLLALRKNLTDRTAVGLLTLGSVLVVALVRIRAHFFLTAAPPYLMFLAVLAFKRRRLAFLIPFVAFAVLFALIYLETNSGAYNVGSTQLGISYGPFAQTVTTILPLPLQQFISLAPLPLQPFLTILLWATVEFIGVFYLALIALHLVRLLLRRDRDTGSDLFLFATILVAIILASFIVLNLAINTTGDWGSQALSLLPRAAMLLTIAPLFWLVSGIVKNVPVLRQQYAGLAVGALLVSTLISYRAADVTILQSALRAYPITTQEQRMYQWIHHNAPLDAVFAADPEHVVNAAGETIIQTNFLSGETERPVFLQRKPGFDFNMPEFTRRSNLLTSIFDATTPQELRQVLSGASFDYLIVYPDRQPKTDLSCCMVPIITGQTQLFRLEH